MKCNTAVSYSTGHGQPTHQHEHDAESDRGTARQTVHLPHTTGHEVGMGLPRRRGLCAKDTRSVCQGHEVCVPRTRGLCAKDTRSVTLCVFFMCPQQGFMQDQIVASDTRFGGHMDVNC